VRWAEPLPDNSEMHSGFNHSTLVITDVEALNTRLYACEYVDHPERYADIYVFVPGTLLFISKLLNSLKIVSTFVFDSPLVPQILRFHSCLNLLLTQMRWA